MRTVDFREPGEGARLAASVRIACRGAELEEQLAAAVAALTLPRAPRYRTVRLRTAAAIEAVGSLAGHLAIVDVRSATRLADQVARLRAAEPLGIQLVFDDRRFDVARATRLRAAVFRVLEAARGQRGCPLFLARTRRPTLALRLAVHAKGAPGC